MMMEMIVFSLCLYLETNNASSRHGHMENKANIVDDEDAADDDHDHDDHDDVIGKESGRQICLEKSFEVGINNDAKCDYNWSSWGRKVQ